jgi:hypothetical protein
MRCVRALAVALVLLVVAVTPGFAFPNEPGGFRGASWGCDIAALHDMEILGRDDKTQRILARRRNDIMSLGDVPLGKIEYIFWGRRFMLTRLSTLGQEHFLGLLRVLTGRYGQPHQANRFIPSYTWAGTVGFVSLEYDDRTGDVLVSIASTRLILQYSEYARKAANSAADRTF